jgi:hypothetical protein
MLMAGQDATHIVEQEYSFIISKCYGGRTRWPQVLEARGTGAMEVPG